MTGFATMLLGPRSGGRGYQRLAERGLPAISAAARDVFDSIPLALAGWAETGEPDFLASIPLTDADAPVLIVRARFIGQGSAGSIAFANVVLVDRALPPETLLAIAAVIPQPDGSTGFAEANFRPDPPPIAGVPHDWRDLGLAWKDRILLTPPAFDRETMLASALLAIDPPVQRGRVRGWSTTAALRPAGGFNPARSFQLVVAAADAPAALRLPHLPARVTEHGFEGAEVGPPPVWRMWQSLRSLRSGDAAGGAIDRAIDALGWAVPYADMPEDKLAEAALRHLCLELGWPDRFWFLARASASEDATIRTCAGALFGETVVTGATADVAELAALWFAADEGGRSALVDPVPALLARGDAARLPPALLATLLARRPEAAEAVVRAMSAEDCRDFAGFLIEADDWSEGDASLAAMLIVAMAEHGSDEARSLAAAGAGRALDWSAVPEVRGRLLRPSVVSALAGTSASLANRYSAQLLRLRDAVADHDPGQFAIALAALIRLQDRKASHA